MSQQESMERVMELRRALSRLKLPQQAAPWERPENSSRSRKP